MISKVIKVTTSNFSRPQSLKVLKHIMLGILHRKPQVKILKLHKKNLQELVMGL